MVGGFLFAVWFVSSLVFIASDVSALLVFSACVGYECLKAVRHSEGRAWHLRAGGISFLLCSKGIEDDPVYRADVFICSF
jgi:hypothetical protein